MTKTETIRQRRIDVWAPSLSAKEEWKEAARQAGTSLSKYFIQAVESTLAQDTEDLGKANDELRERLLDLEAQLQTSERRVDELTQLKDRLDADLETYRAQDMQESEGIKQLDPRLIRMLAESRDPDGRQRAVAEDDFKRRLAIHDDPDRLKSLALQLEALEMHGIIRSTAKGWVWHGQ